MLRSVEKHEIFATCDGSLNLRRVIEELFVEGVRTVGFDRRMEVDARSRASASCKTVHDSTNRRVFGRGLLGVSKVWINGSSTKSFSIDTMTLPSLLIYGSSSGQSYSDCHVLGSISQGGTEKRSQKWTRFLFRDISSHRDDARCTKSKDVGMRSTRTNSRSRGMDTVWGSCPVEPLHDPIAPSLFSPDHVRNPPHPPSKKKKTGRMVQGGERRREDLVSRKAPTIPRCTSTVRREASRNEGSIQITIHPRNAGDRNDPESKELGEHGCHVDVDIETLFIHRSDGTWRWIGVDRSNRTHGGWKRSESNGWVFVQEMIRSESTVHRSIDCLGQVGDLFERFGGS